MNASRYVAAVLAVLAGLVVCGLLYVVVPSRKGVDPTRPVEKLEVGVDLTQDAKLDRHVSASASLPEVYAQMPLLPPLPGYGTITCDVALTANGIQSGTVSVSDGALGTALLIRGKVVVQVPAGSGTAAFSFYDLGAGSLSWQNLEDGGSGACTAGSVETLRSGIFGRIEGQRLSGSYVVGCGGLGEIADDSFFMSVDAPLECSVLVKSVVDGQIARGPALVVQTAVGRDSQVVLRYPRESDYRSLTAEELAGRRELEELLEDLDAKGSVEAP